MVASILVALCALVTLVCGISLVGISLWSALTIAWGSLEAVLLVLGVVAFVISSLGLLSACGCDVRNVALRIFSYLQLPAGLGAIVIVGLGLANEQRCKSLRGALMN